MVICFWLLSLGDIRHLSSKFKSVCLFVILDWLSVALSNFHHCMLRPSLPGGDIIARFVWKSIIQFWSYSENNKVTYLATPWVNLYILRETVSEPHIWSTMMSLVSIYSGWFDWDGQCSLWFFYLIHLVQESKECCQCVSGFCLKKAQLWAIVIWNHDRHLIKGNP